eukprot:3906747-Alexandrium_andersonii.AAC.1
MRSKPCSGAVAPVSWLAPPFLQVLPQASFTQLDAGKSCAASRSRSRRAEAPRQVLPVDSLAGGRKRVLQLGRRCRSGANCLRGQRACVCVRARSPQAGSSLAALAWPACPARVES